jgi:hypothetical protein
VQVGSLEGGWENHMGIGSSAALALPSEDRAFEVQVALAGFLAGYSGNTRVERVRRIELPYSAWEADVLPLNYTRRRR